MVRALAGSLPVIVVAVILGNGGCAGSASPLVSLQPQYLTSRNGALQYRCPVGWFDATADTQAAGHVIWLLRNDYGATIAVSGLYLDAAAREEVRAGGMARLAELTMTLAAGGKPYVVERSPEALSMNGWRGCTYELATSPDGDLLRVALVDGGKSLYMVTALCTDDAQRGQREAMRGAQDAFLSSLRW